MSDPTTNEIAETAAKVGGGGLLGWLLKVFLERTVKRTDDLEAKAQRDLEIRVAKLEERVDNNRDKSEERVNGVASYWSAKISSLEREIAELKGALSKED